MVLISSTTIYSSSVIFVSWGIGAAVNFVIRPTKLYRFIADKLFISNRKSYEYLGVVLFKYLVSKTIYAKINKSMFLKSFDFTEIKKLKRKMVDSEVGHLFGFIFSQLIFVVNLLKAGDFKLFLLASFINLVFNLYPFLLQLMNIERINRILVKKNNERE